MFLAVSLPIAPRVRVAVQGEDERADRVLHACLYPFLGPLLTREPDPSRVAAKLGLSVCLFCVCLLWCCCRFVPGCPKYNRRAERRADKMEEEA